MKDDPKNCAQKALVASGMDPENFRTGFTKVRISRLKRFRAFGFMNTFFFRTFNTEYSPNMQLRPVWEGNSI